MGISKIIEWEVIIGEIGPTRWIGAARVGAGNLNWVAKWFKIDGVGLLGRTGRKAERRKGQKGRNTNRRKNIQGLRVSPPVHTRTTARECGHLPYQVRLFPTKNTASIPGAEPNPSTDRST